MDPGSTRLVVVWLILSGITLVQLAIGSTDGRAAVAAIGIGIALIKVRIIVHEFMEIRHAPASMGRLTDLWVVLTAAMLLGGHLAGASFARG